MASSSSSRPRLQKYNEDALISILECPVCFDILSTPITGCVNGHYLCSHCVKNIQGICPQCRGRMTDFRCAALEGLTEKLSFPYKFSNQGCDFRANSTHIKGHQDECYYSFEVCTLRDYGCSWTGPFRMLRVHLMEKHHD